ncbi:mechanosensitive ion channel family protein [Lunatimonas salinarum]|uniref:mechanosensitive ion channel family protein n=1 Tax=Lunatimonas salinarum TaxID=1774590 RepID=UPI001ADF7DC3|nr:mechanosensitive ion channel domain-containing protein [Lunatimonas salinarum]
MNPKKDQIEVSERKRRSIFLVKIVVYIALLVGSEYLGPLIQPYFPKINRYLTALEVVVAGNLVISLGRIILIRFYLRRKRRTGLHGNFVLGINRIASILNVIIVLLGIMVLVDIQPLEFLSSITIVAAAIALLSKDYITNMINGLIIMFSDQLTLGDHIKMGEFKGKIQDITLLNVIIANEDDDLVMIPNSLILSSHVINHSRQNIKKMSFEFETKLSDKLNLDSLENSLIRHLNPVEKHISKNSFVLKAIAIQRDAVKIKVQFQLISGDRAVEKKIKRMINQKIIQLSSEL